MTSLDIQKAYVGGTEVDKIYLGNEVIYPSTPPEPAYSAMPLTFEIISGGTITWERYAGSSSEEKTIQYSLNDGEWISIKSATGGSQMPSITVAAGDKIQFKGANNRYYPSTASNRFRGTALFKAYGNILSMIYDEQFLNYTELSSANTSAFRALFYGNTGIIEANNLIMPQNVVTSCFRSMFEDCTNLIKAPTLPAAQLAPYCYQYLFANCSNLNFIKCLATITATDATTNWVSQVAPTGTFVKDATMSSWTTGISGIPSGWTVQDA